MAGNAKEWCWTANGEQRYILGGGWNEAVYMFMDLDARAPFDRSPLNGVRLVQSRGDPPQTLMLTLTNAAVRDYTKEKSVSEQLSRRIRGCIPTIAACWRRA